jgi:hypothetical protein
MSQPKNDNNRKTTACLVDASSNVASFLFDFNSSINEMICFFIIPPDPSLEQNIENHTGISKTTIYTILSVSNRNT